MVVKLRYSGYSGVHEFESSVISYGSEAREVLVCILDQFESRVILYASNSTLPDKISAAYWRRLL